jgi:hypothetical protein
MFAIILDNTILNVTLPTLANDVHATTPIATLYKGFAAAVVVLMGVAGVVLAQTSHSKPAATGIDSRRAETLAWSLQLDPDSRRSS